MTKQLLRISLLLLASASVLASARDDVPPSPVGFTEVRESSLSPRIELPGTVDAPRSSLVASEVEGRVAKLLVREGQHVKKGATLVELDNAHLVLDRTRAEADLRESQARLALADAAFERARRLEGEGVLSRQQRDDAELESRAWQGRVDRLAAEVERIELDIERSRVKAPFSGVVAAELTEVGQWVAKGASVVDLLSPYSLEVLIDVPERYFSQVRRGGAATVRLESLADLKLEGKVASIVPRANAQSRTFPVRVRIDNPDGRLGAGMVATVELTGDDSRSARLVPKDAVVTRGDGRFVYVLEQDETAKLVPVTTGQATGDWVSVEGPLSVGMKVITRGNERLRPGQRVNPTAQSYSAS